MELELFEEFMYDDLIDDIYTEDDVGNDMRYHTLLRTVNDAERYNYHSDYWGDADSYQQDVIDTVSHYAHYVDKEVIIPFEDESIKATIKGFLIDDQYNGHALKILIEDVSEV